MSVLVGPARCLLTYWARPRRARPQAGQCDPIGIPSGDEVAGVTVITGYQCLGGPNVPVCEPRRPRSLLDHERPSTRSTDRPQDVAAIGAVGYQARLPRGATQAWGWPVTAAMCSKSAS